MPAQHNMLISAPLSGLPPWQNFSQVLPAPWQNFSQILPGFNPQGILPGFFGTPNGALASQGHLLNTKSSSANPFVADSPEFVPSHPFPSQYNAPPNQLISGFAEPPCPPLAPRIQQTADDVIVSPIDIAQSQPGTSPPVRMHHQPQPCS
jgi:hypothetical protein